MLIYTTRTIAAHHQSSVCTGVSPRLQATERTKEPAASEAQYPDEIASRGVIRSEKGCSTALLMDLSTEKGQDFTRPFFSPPRRA